MQRKTLLGAVVFDEARALAAEELMRLPYLGMEVPNVERGHRRRK